MTCVMWETISLPKVWNSEKSSLQKEKNSNSTRFCFLSQCPKEPQIPFKIYKCNYSFETHLMAYKKKKIYVIAVLLMQCISTVSCPTVWWITDWADKLNLAGTTPKEAVNNGRMLQVQEMQPWLYGTIGKGAFVWGSNLRCEAAWHCRQLSTSLEAPKCVVLLQ